MARRRWEAPGPAGAPVFGLAGPARLNVGLAPLRGGGAVLIVERKKLLAALRENAKGASQVTDPDRLIRNEVYGAGFKNIRFVTHETRRYLLIYGDPDRIWALKDRWYQRKSVKVCQAAIGELPGDRGRIRGVSVSFFLADAVEALGTALCDPLGLRKDIPFNLAADGAGYLAQLLLGETPDGFAVEPIAAGGASISCAPLPAGLGTILMAGIMPFGLVDTHHLAWAMRVWCERRLGKARRLLADAGRVVDDADEVWREFRKTVSSIEHAFPHVEWALMASLSGIGR
jgi:hypothetical protein